MAMNEYCIRVDVVGDEEALRARLTTWLAKYGDSLGVREGHDDNPHFHVWLKSRSKLQAVRANFKSTFKEHVGNRCYSIKAAPGNLQYLAKGDSEASSPDVFVNTMGVTDDELREAHDARWATANEIEVTRSAGGGDKPPSFFEVVQRSWRQSTLYLEVRATHGGHCLSRWDVDSIARRIAVWLVHEFRCMKKLMDLPIIKKYVNLLILDIVSEEDLVKAWLGDRPFYG